MDCGESVNANAIVNGGVLSPKRGCCLKLGLWNIRGLGQGDKLHSILNDAMARNLNVVVLTETRFFGQTCLGLDGGHTLYNSGATNDQRTNGGVGFLVCAGRDSAPHVVKFEGLSERVATLVLDHKGARFGVCAAYAPTESSPSDYFKEIFCKELAAAYSSLKRVCKTVFVLGDFNCRLGRDAHSLAPKVVGTGGFDGVPTSENGLRVLDFCKANGLRVWNTWFKRKRVRRNTWYHPATKRGAMLDLVLGPVGVKTCRFKDVRVCRSAEGADSDHYLVTA